MKQVIHFLSLILTGGLFAQNGQLPNGGMENWTNHTLYEQLLHWESSNENEYNGVVLTMPSTDAQSGSKSVEMHVGTNGNDTIFGYVFQGSFGSEGPSGGVPYTDNFNTVKFYYKSSINAGDSAYMLLIRFSGGAVAGQSLLPIATGTVSNWTQASIAVPAGSQDSLFIAFVMGDPFNENLPLPGSWMKLDNVQLYDGATLRTNLVDNGFENWQTVMVETPDDWYTRNERLAGHGLANTTKTTDAFQGAFAVQLETIVDQNGDTTAAYLSLGDFMSANMHVPYEGSPTSMQGVYKYNSEGGDPASISIIFYENGMQVGFAFHEFSADESNFTLFSIPINLNGTPDSVSVFIQSGSRAGEKLTLDALSFNGGNVGLEEFGMMTDRVYPNPATTELYVKAEGDYSFELTDMQGKTVLQVQNLTGVNQLSLSEIPAGSYIAVLHTSAGTEIHKLIKR